MAARRLGLGSVCATVLCALIVAAQVVAPASAADWIEADTDPDGRWVGEPITLSLRDADLVEVLRSFARIADFNLILQPGLQGKVTVEFKDVPWDQALDAILRMHGLGMDVTGSTVRVATYQKLEDEARHGARLDASPLLEPRRIEGTLQHADARAVARVLRDGGYLSSYGRAEAFGGNVLRIDERFGRIRRVAKLVSELDVAANADADVAALADRARAIWRGLAPQ